MIRPLKLLAFVLLGLLVLSPPLLAQTSPDDTEQPPKPTRSPQDGHGKRDKKKRARLAAVKKKVLIQKVGLTEAEADDVLALFVEQEEKRRALRRRLRASHRTLKQLVADDSQDDAAYAAALEELKRVRAELLAHREQQLEALEERLSPRKRVRLLAAMRKIQRRMHKKPGKNR